VRTQRWRSLGRVFVATGESQIHYSHASYPTPLVLSDNVVRVFYSPRDAEGRSSVFSLDVAFTAEGFELVGPPQGPWLEPGPAGAFDDAGTSVSCVVRKPHGGLECWYLGWSLGVSVPFRTAIGVADAEPGEAHFRRRSFAPILDRASVDPLSLGYPWIVDHGNERWIWYGTHRYPPTGGRKIDHVIRRARSRDGGLNWIRDPDICLEHEGLDEWGLSRPSVLRDANGWHMWFARRLDTYRLGYAHSHSGERWVRYDDAVFFSTPAGDWESDSRTYPAVFDCAGRRWMLYNGSGYGRSGFGLAVLES
jgi:hypothetical protein